MSGAPKIRAMQIIADLEDTTRGLYGGGVWANSVSGGASVLASASPHQSGVGCVSDSEPEAEFQEAANKSKAMLKAVAPAETFGKTALAS